VARVGSAVPSLVISGEDDILVAPGKSIALAELLASAAGRAPAIHTVPRTSHQCMQEDPEAVNELIAAFMAGLRGQASSARTL
jgi:pimeloyl-ACP methyl ester carboxylesterase